MVHGRVSANTEHLAEFVLHGQPYLTGLGGTAGAVQAARIAANRALGSGSRPAKSELLLAGLQADIAKNTQFVSDIHDALQAFGIYNAGIVTASVEQIDNGITASPPDDEKRELNGVEDERAARHRVVAAMEAGLSPDESGLPEEFFPWNYRLLLTQERGLAELAADRDEADGSRWNPFDGSRADRNRLDRAAKMQQSVYNQTAASLGADGSGRLTKVEAIGALGDWTGDRTWEGDQYGDWVNAYYNTNLAKNEAGQATLNHHDSSELGNEFALIGKELAIEPETAVSFYNKIGAQGTTYLPTALVDSVSRTEGDWELHGVMADFGTGLGHASRQQTAAGENLLGFSGGALIAEPLPTRPGDPIATNHPDTVRSASPNGPRATHEIYHQSFLFAAGDFSPSFLAEATVETLVQADHDPTKAGTIHSSTGRGGAIRHRGRGEDPRNILLARSGERVATAAAVVDKLDSENRVDLLLYHKVPFQAAYVGDNAFAPKLDPDVPIARFLQTAGSNDRAAHRLVKEASWDWDRSTPVADTQFSDVGVAAGMDSILAQHATLMYPVGSVERVGITQTTINADTTPRGRPKTFGDSDLTAEEWKAAHGKVLHFGQGRLLNQKAKELVVLSIDGAMVDGRFDNRLSAPFATFLGGIEAETVEGMFAHSARLDDEAREYNRRVNTTVSAGIGLAGLAGPGISAAAGAGGSLHTYFDPFSIPTNNELETYRDQYQELSFVQSDHSTQWSNALNSRFLIHAAERGEIEIVVPGTAEPMAVPLRRPGDHLFEWQHPDTKEWSELPVATDSRNREFFAGTEVEQVIGQAGATHRNYMNGLLYATDSKEDITERRIAGKTDEHIQIYSQQVAVNQRLDEADVGAKGARLDDWLADGQ